MKKAGIITHYYNSHNIGGLLQAYALCKAVEKIGIEAEQICYRPTLATKESWTLAKKLQLAQALHCSPLQLFEKAAEKTQNNFRKNPTEEATLINQQWKQFKTFEEQIPHSDKVYTDETISEANAVYDLFLCGSDVIWHPGNLSHPAYYLQFSEPEKPKIAYAASMGRLPQTPIEKSLFAERIAGIPYISVREKCAAEYIKKNIRCDVEPVLDPTLLLTADEWADVESTRLVPECKYAFCYFLGKRHYSRISTAQFCKERGLQIIYLPYIMGNERNEDAPLKQLGKGIYDFGPADIVGLIHHAEYIFTDSFHAVAFSTIFRKRFFAFDRDEKRKMYSINSRIDDFLKTYSLQSHHVESESVLMEKSAIILQENIVLTNSIASSYKFLQSSMSQTQKNQLKTS